MDINTAIDVKDLKLGEVADMEEKAGKPVSQILADMRSGEYAMKDLLAFVWVIGRRQDPDFTWDEARELSLADIEIN